MVNPVNASSFSWRSSFGGTNGVFLSEEEVFFMELGVR
jgi:hypothetical protein